MATNSLSSRLEELRSRNPQSPPSERAYSGYSTPARYSGTFSNMHSTSQSVSATNDPRSSSMQRRSTADSNSFANQMPPIGYQSMDVPNDLQSYQQAQAIEKKRAELERLREQKARMEDEFKRLTSLHREQDSEITKLTEDLKTMNFATGAQSEPTTPPEYRDLSSYSQYNRSNRYSSASMQSPPGFNRMSRSGSQVASPPNELVQQNGDNNGFTSRSNRYSMPVSLSARQKRESLSEFPPVGATRNSTSGFPGIGLAPIDTTSILFGDDDDHDLVTSPAVKNYLQDHTTGDKFPVLLRNNHKPGTLSASSAALDLASLQSPNVEAKVETRSNGWPTFNRQHQAQHSLPQNNLNGRSAHHTPSLSQQSVETVIEAPYGIRNSNRHSMEATLASLASQARHLQSSSTSSQLGRPGLAGFQSHSMNEVPTMKGNITSSTTHMTSPNANNDKSFHNHNVSLGRIPNGLITNRLSRDLTTGEALADEPPSATKPRSSELQASAPSFGPALSSINNNNESALMSSPEFQQQQFAVNGNGYNPYGMSMLNTGMNPMSFGAVNGANFTANGLPFYHAQPPQLQQQQAFGNNGFVSQYNNAGQYQNGQQRGGQSRRGTNSDSKPRGSRRSSGAQSDGDQGRFHNVKIESYAGNIYSLCKDQHGCRYLQKQLETRHPETVQLIFSETAPHVIELMTDPFGNYLCQKLLEHTNDSQRTTLVENAAPHMVDIALNQHGTRALQKMIEHLSTDEQIKVVRNALGDKVVDLIQDLNGNHVIQKCLNRLTSEESQFIFDAVGKNCVVVGTHRHGCCVLQRCIDHASGSQKADLIAQITANAFKLVQDPYGNYVLQYIIDLGTQSYTDALCYTFQNRVVDLSRHKFSSNVIEKCIRHSAPAVATIMINEMLGAAEIERMLRDSFANYVIQTALDHAETDTRARLVEAIKPFLPSIRHTPHGRRIQSKVQDGTPSTGPSPTMSPMPGTAAIRGPGPMNRNGSGQHGNFYNQGQQTGYPMNGFGAQPGFAPMNGHVNGPVNGPANGHVNGQRGPSNGQRGPSNGNYQYNQNRMPQGMPQAYGRGQQSSGYNFF